MAGVSAGVDHGSFVLTAPLGFVAVEAPPTPAPAPAPLRTFQDCIFGCGAAAQLVVDVGCTTLRHHAPRCTSIFHKSGLVQQRTSGEPLVMNAFEMSLVLLGKKIFDDRFQSHNPAGTCNPVTSIPRTDSPVIKRMRSLN
eukprot:SAG11_NODE_5894_length_1439_cov_1.565672_2_plen_140_part_00